MPATTVTLAGKRFIILPEEEYKRLRRGGAAVKNERGLPPLPKPLANGNYPAVEYARASVARDIIQRRRQVGLSQAELARQAGVRVETLNRIEKAKMTPSVATVEKIERALRAEE